MDAFDCTTRRAGDRRLRRRALQLVRAPQPPPLLGGRPRGLRDPAPLPGRGRRKLLAPFMPFLADEIYANLVGGRVRRVRRRARLGPPRATSPSPTRRSSTRSSRPAWRRCAAPSSSAAPRAPTPRSRSASRCARRSSSPPTRSARRSSASPSSSPSELNVKELEFVAEESDLVALPRQAELPRPRPALRQGHAPGQAPRSRRSTPQHVSKALEAGGEVGISIDGHDHPSSADDDQPGDGAARGLRGRGRGRPRGRARARARRRAARRGPRRARSSTPSRTRARAPASTSPTGSSSRSAATPSCSTPPAPTRPTSAARRWPRSVAYGEADRRRAHQSTAASCGSRSPGRRSERRRGRRRRSTSDLDGVRSSSRSVRPDGEARELADRSPAGAGSTRLRSCCTACSSSRVDSLTCATT